MMNYIIELALIHTAFMVGYWLLLRKEQQYTKMRFYLLGTSLLAILIPFLKLPKLLYSPEPIYMLPVANVSEEVTPIAMVAEVPSWDFSWLIWIYFAISSFFLLQFLGNLIYLRYLERNSLSYKWNGLQIRKSAQVKGTFTFLHWIFINDKITSDQPEYGIMLQHEQAHVRLLHTYDLLFFELLKICFWWLPTIWLMLKEIKIIHEYQADAFALQSCNLSQYSSILISSTLKLNGLSLASSFHDGLILKRLIAMKQQAKNLHPWKLWSLTGLCALLILVFACSEEKELTALNDAATQEIFNVVEEYPSFEGGMDAFYGYIRKNIRYPKLARENNVEGLIVVQFVVNREGKLTNVQTVRAIGAGCDEEAERVLKNAPDFKPGKQRGRTVNVRMQIPIQFKLDASQRNADNSAFGMIIVEEAKLKKSQLKVDASYANGEWSGTVYDEEGNALPGTSIVVAGTSSGTVSDLDGTFKVKASSDNPLHFSFVGYETVQLDAK